MIVVRNTFQLKFGKAKDAKALLQQIRQKSSKDFTPARILTDITGPYYTVVLEFEQESLSAWEAEQKQTLNDPSLRPLFEQFYALVESGHREIFSVME